VVLDWSPGRPGEVLGRILAASVAGFALGPVIGALLAERFGLRVPFLVPAAILLMAVPVVTRLRAPEPTPIIEERSFLSLLGNRLVMAGVVFAAIEFATLGSFDAVWARLLTDQGASTLFIGGSFTLMALPLVFLAARFGRLVDRKSSVLVASFGILAMAPAVLALGWLNAPVALGAAGFVMAIGSSAISPAAAALVAEGSPPDMIARGQGLLEAVGFLAAAAAALPTGWAYETIGRATWFTGLSAVTIALFAIGRRLSRRPPR
jgi:DHA1 family multidrug resistance protein-like MFS transporter